MCPLVLDATVYIYIYIYTKDDIYVYDISMYNHNDVYIYIYKKLDCIFRVRLNLLKENGFTQNKARNTLYPAENIKKRRLRR